MVLVASRREAITAAVNAYNRTHPKAPLPRPAARLLAVMFADGEVCCRSQETLAGEGFDRKMLPKLLRRLVEAGLLLKQAAGTSRITDEYRLLLP
jgi:hypothetical protein